ncbi:MAG: cell surface protein SprA [Balneola sp.]|nr:cell surface protein SprA [Balneola sp.]|tara:strand:- start:219795 stop:227090 length:7296 start_codon:yes stop_codon:yes gene_type:complete
MNGLLLVGASAQDSTATDTTVISIQADSVAADSMPEGMKFIYRAPTGPASIAPAVQPGKMYYIKLPKERYEASWDSADTYTVQRKIDGIDVGVPSKYSFEEFAEHKKRQQIKSIQYSLVEEGKQQQADQRGLLDFSLQIPGGESSVFTTIFGKPEVNLRVNGSANMNVGVSIQNVDDPTIAPDLQRRIDPTFNQNLQLNIQGTIGDKLTIATDWDTERAFDFQNRLSIVYEGYEDEIIKQIQLGNVSMETGNSLIRGGASLFGIKSVAELGPLKLTSVVSQQKGESESETITGGSQETQISIRPIEYQNNRHFFIDFFNRQQFESNVSNPQQITQAYQISDIKVWISEPQINTTDPEAVRAAAFADLGVVERNGSFSLPNPAFDSIDDALLDQNRSETSASAGDFNVSGNDFYNGYFRPLQEGADYSINKALGYISLNRTLSSGAYLAVSFVRRGVAGESEDNIQVGDISPQSSGLTYLKLLRTDNPTPDQRTWPLTMRNIYSLGVSDLTQDGLEFDIKFTRGNVDDTNLPNRNATLLQDLGLDRTDTQGALNPDNRIDFTGIVLDPRSGVVLFPYLEPFGQRIASLLEQTAASDSVISSLAYTELYNEKQNTADKNNKNNYYKLEGTSKGGVSGNFTLGFSLVEGSVKVFANGTELTEGVDYEVDYSFGSITILNEQYLAAGQDIQVEYENNQLNQIGQKNFTGVRAEYQITEDIQVGGTFFKLKEQPLSDKIRVENESINNTILGMDASAEFDTPWVTRAIDKVPLLQTKAESNVSFSGEFAQLRPGVSQTNAVREAIENGELYEDEENGLSFIDDFEGSEVSISLTSATRWNLAAAPAAITGYAPDEAFFENEDSPLTNSLESKIDRSDLRSQFSWYTIPRNVTNLLGGVQRTAESERVLTEAVFPGRETNNAQDEEITTLDVYYNPQERGPYNYNFDLKNKLENEPEKMWGGMTATLPSGQEDLTQNNIEFIEFWVQPILPDGREPTAQDLQDYDGKIYIEIGTISEDVVPNFDLNTEDGLASNPDNLEPDNLSSQPRSFVPANPTAPQGQFSNENRELEDVGFDGVPNSDGFDEEKVETFLFAEFIDSMRVAYGPDSPEFQSILADPSNDDYVYYGEGRVQELPLNERFHRLLGYHEGNTPVAGGDKRAITPRPDSEGLKSRSNIETNNNYYQYEVALNPAEDLQIEIDPGQQEDRTYIVDRVPGERQQDRWHLVRIPLSEFKRKVGDIDGFQNISHIRMWMSGYEKPFTMRFATFEFIGSQWRKVEEIDETQNATGDFQVSTINIEENANREPVPYRQPEGSIRALNRGVQINTLENEQSIVVRAEELGPQQIQMIKRVYPGGLNLLNYSNMRMFVHGEGYRDDSKSDRGRRDAELVIRMGTDLNTSYYEYRQPVTPSDPEFNYSTYSPDGGSGELALDAEQVWLYDENSMNIILGAFNEIKQIREQRGITDINQRFEIPLMQDGEELAEGATIAIKGNPSLGRVAEIGMGIRNPYDPADPSSPGSPSLTAEFWLNELRLSGFDNETGWKANAKASFKMADFATVNTNFTRTTTGFGGLDSRLGNRSIADELGYDLSSTVNLHKLIPDRFGWSFPVSVSTRRSISTPKFLPNQGDTRTQDFINATRNNEELTEAEQNTIIDERLNSIETVRESFSINVSNISKKNSKSKLAQYTLDNTRLSYVYNQGNLKNPETQFQDDWNFTSSISYNLSFNNVKLWQPFEFTEDIPVLGVMSGLRFGYMPTSINASANLNRSYNEKRRRPRINDEGEEQLQPLQQSQTFNHKSSFGFNYNFTPSIPISFRSNTNYDLSGAGRVQTPRTDLEIDSTSYQLRPTFSSLEGIITDTLSARRSNYQETYTASWRPKFNNMSALDWMTYSASYSGGYGWTNSPSGSGLGAEVSNTYRLDHTLKLGVGDLLDRISFFEDMKEADQEESRERQRAKNSNNNLNAEEGEEAGPDLFKDAQYLGRKLVLALFSMQNIDITYNQNKTSNQAGYLGNSEIFYTFSDPSGGKYSPPLGYRLGIAEEIPISQLIQESPSNSAVNIPKNNTYSDKIGVGTKLSLFSNLSVDLNWRTEWDERQTQNISLTPDGEFGSTVSSSGNIGSSVWAFGSGYGDLFERQLETAFGDLNQEAGVISDETEAGGNGDGRIVLNRNTLADDFRYAYLGSGNRAIGEKGYTPIPLPNWRVTWSGVEKLIPFIGKAMSAASLTHSYQGNYRLGWNLNTITGLQDPQGLGSFNLIDNKDLYEPASINVEQRFSPLVQLNVTWESNLRTQISMDRSRTTSLALSSSTVTERTSQGLNTTINYTFRNLTIPFFPKIKNNVDLSISGGVADDTEEKFYLNQDIDEALSSENLIFQADQYDYNEPFVTGQTRINGSLNIGYRFSQTVTSNFEYTFTNVSPKSSAFPPRTNHEIRFNFRIAIQSR